MHFPEEGDMETNFTAPVGSKVPFTKENTVTGYAVVRNKWMWERKA